MIPFADPHAGYLARKDEIDAAVARVFASGRYILGPEVAAFEAEFAAWTGAEFCVGVGNGTEALHLALAALGVGPGDEVVTVSHTAVATVAAIAQTGAKPVFADIDPGTCTPSTYTMDPQALARAITPKTKAVVPVHLYGHPAALDEILAIAEAHGLPVVEDCAQAHGAELSGRRVGSIGRLGCFSFYPTKNLGALGDGGCVTTSDPELAARLRRMREYGWENRVSVAPGWNSRLDEVQAAILRAKLPHLDADIAARGRIAKRYQEELAGLPLDLPQTRTGARHAFHLFVVRTPRREELLRHLYAHGIGAAVHYPLAAHQQPTFAHLAPPLPRSEAASASVLSLPMYPELSEAQAGQVIQAVQRFFA
jgi:dTDP-4-amino-4,6-dideoxygalactose transaminase